MDDDVIPEVSGGTTVEGLPPRRPTWVKVLGVIVLVVVAALILMKVAGGGSHGPGRHSAPAWSSTAD